MDTPDRNQIGPASVTKIENSPVFNYINSLSPIKPLKATHTDHAFNSLSFRAVTSVFSSLYANSARGSSLVQRHSYADRSKPISPSNGNEVCTNQRVFVSVDQVYGNSDMMHEHFDTGVSSINPSEEIPSRNLKSTVDLSQTMAYTCGGHGCSPSGDRFGIQSDFMSESGGTSCLLTPYDQDGFEEGSYGREKNIVCHIERTKEGIRHCWESLISDTGNPSIFTSPDCSKTKRLIQDLLEPETKLCSDLMSHLASNEQSYTHEQQSIDSVITCEQEANHSSLPTETNEPKEIMPAIHTYAYSRRNMNVYAEEETYNELLPNFHNATWRRCLDFEMAGDCQKGTEDGTNSSYSMLSQSDEKVFASNKQVVHSISSGHSFSCILPGIGLHLNALAKNLKDRKNASEENFSFGRQLSLPCSTGQSHVSTSHEPLFTLAESEKEMDSSDNGVQMEESAPQASHNVVKEDFYWDSSKKKRLRSELAGENESCQRCHCKKSKCLKLYCECFASGVYCIEPCSCQECFNKPIHEATVLATRNLIESRNPLAFAPKVISSFDYTAELGDFPLKTPASSRHKRGCNCKKSSCLKKYCECFQGGVGCSSSCRCEGCKNAFGKKDGNDRHREEPKSSVEIQKKDEQNLGSALPITPIRNCRPFTVPYQTPSAFGAEQKLEKPSILRACPKFEKDDNSVLEGNMPKILYGDCSSRTIFRTASPNSKRVSPLYCDSANRVGRKLILRSIPSFSHLSPQ